MANREEEEERGVNISPAEEGGRSLQDVMGEAERGGRQPWEGGCRRLCWKSGGRL